MVDQKEEWNCEIVGKKSLLNALNQKPYNSEGHLQQNQKQQTDTKVDISNRANPEIDERLEKKTPRDITQPAFENKNFVLIFDD